MQEASTWKEWVARIRQDAGSPFDPSIAEAFLDVVESGWLAEVW